MKKKPLQKILRKKKNIFQLKYKEKYLKLKTLQKTLQNGGNKCHLCKNNRVCVHQRNTKNQ